MTRFLEMISQLIIIESTKEKITSRINLFNLKEKILLMNSFNS